jgi:hypothetical protein
MSNAMKSGWKVLLGCLGVALAATACDSGDGAVPGAGGPVADAAFAALAFDDADLGRVVPMDLESEDLSLGIDASSGRATGQAELRFTVREPGAPMLLLDRVPTRIELDGQPLGADALATVAVAGRSDGVRVLKNPARPGETHLLRVEYDLADRVTFQDGQDGQDGAASVGFFMDDNAGYLLERYAPANFEVDQFRLRMQVALDGAATAPRVFTNGSLRESGAGRWEIDFPETYNSSAPFFHLVSGTVETATRTFAGARGPVPVTVYGDPGAGVEAAADRAVDSLGDMESRFGPYPHPSLVVYLASPGGQLSGMEYAGASVSTSRSLNHEIAHSWFGRGVMPTDGNAGWIDEAIVTWRDLGYPRASAGAAVSDDLALAPPWSEITPAAAYTSGASFMAQLDRDLADRGGLAPLLRALATERAGQVLSTPAFEDFLETRSGLDLSAEFARAVYGVSGGIRP